MDSLQAASIATRTTSADVSYAFSSSTTILGSMLGDFGSMQTALMLFSDNRARSTSSPADKRLPALLDLADKSRCTAASALHTRMSSASVWTALVSTISAS